jgi:hypothetical protein
MLRARDCTFLIISTRSHDGSLFAFPAILAGHEEDEPKLDPHEGRVRSFPHMEGIFATHVYITGGSPFVLPAYTKVVFDV